MSDLTAAIEAARNAIGLNEPDATRAITAAAPLIEAKVRAEVAEEIAAHLTADADDEAARPNRDGHSRLIETWLREAAGIARGHAQPAQIDAAGLTPPPEGAGMHEPTRKACGCEGECPTLFKPCPVCGSEVRAVAVDNALATTYHPCGHVVPDDSSQEGNR